MAGDATTVLALLLLVIFTGCGAREAQPEQEVLVLVPRDPDTLDPRMCVDPYCVKLTRMLYRSLVTVHPETLELELDLASSITEVSPLRYDIELERSVRFASGRELTSRDVKATLASTAGPELGSPYQRSYSRFTTVDITGRHSLSVHLAAPHATVLGDLELPILPERLAKGRPLTGMQGDATGPFRLTARRPGRIDLSPNPRYSRGPVPAVGVQIRLLKDDNTRVLRLLGGGGDLVVNAVPPQLVPIFAHRGAGFETRSAPGTGFTYLGLNLEDPALSDVRVRTAIAHAIDRDTLIAGKFGGRAALSVGMIAKGHWAFAEDLPALRFDPNRAMQLLAEAGHPHLELQLQTSTERFRVGLARAIAWMLGNVGIDVLVRPTELGTLKADLAQGRFQMFTMQIPEVLEPNVYDRFFHSASVPSRRAPDSGANRFRYRSAEADRLIEIGRSTTDRVTRTRAYRRLQHLLARELPCIPLWHEDNVSIVAARVRGYFASRTGRFEPLALIALRRTRKARGPLWAQGFFGPPAPSP